MHIFRDNPIDAVLHACCCGEYDYCNTPGVFSIPTPSPMRPPVRVCYEGLSTSNVSFGSEQVCYGDCATLSVVGSVGTTNINVTYYTCEPLAVCQDFGLNNACGMVNITGGVTDLAANITACCCNRNDCNNPDTGSITVPTGGPPTRLCYVGLSIPTANGGAGYINGGPVQCTGQCANATFGIGAANTGVNIYTCDPFDVCSTLDIVGRCA